jgi:hypothetical protein
MIHYTKLGHIGCHAALDIAAALRIPLDKDGNERV